MTLPPKLEKLLENWPAKIISLVAAILVYAFYQISTLETRYFVVPLEVRQGAGLVTTSISEPSVRVSIRGPISELTTLEAKDFTAFADMSTYMDEGSAVVPVQLDMSDNVRIISDVEIKLQPETVAISLEKEQTEYIPVSINYAGGPAHGYEISEIKTVPSFIKIKGPESLVEKIHEAETDVILLEDLTQSISTETEILALNDHIVSGHEGPVTVTVKVVPSKMKRVLNNLPVELKNIPENLEIESEKKSFSMTVSGNELDVENYVPSSNLLYADCSEISGEGEYDVPVHYMTSSKYTVELLDPEMIHVVVTERVLEEADESGE